jgi:hypothetical protein
VSRKMVLSNLLGRKYRWIIVTVGLILGLTSLPALAASNTITPNNGILNVCQGTVCNNTGYQSFTPSSLITNFAGSVQESDTSGTVKIAKVLISVQNADTLQYLQTNGSWALTHPTFNATLTTSSITSGILTQNWTWNLPVALSSSEYVITAQAVDSNGNKEASSPTLPFAVGASTGTGYLTLSFGRSVYEQFNKTGCTIPTPGAMTLDQVLGQLYSLTPSLTAVGNVIIDRTSSTSTNTCVGNNSYPTWAQLSQWQSEYGFNVTSDGETYAALGGAGAISFPYTSPVNGMVIPDLNTEICGSLSVLAQHGFNAVGMFDYPDNHLTDSIQLSTTANCFDFGRVYYVGRNIQALDGTGVAHNGGGDTGSQYWYAKTVSINGGDCNDPNPADTCHDIKTATRQYENVPELEALVKVDPGEWVNLQAYRLVTGSNINSTSNSWDCTSPNWYDHWTGQSELFCDNDYLSVMSSIPSTTVVTDPATVATAWGRSVL